MKLRLVENWQQSWRWASIRLAAVAAIVAGILTANPSFALGLIGLLPAGPMRTIAAVGVSLLVFVIPALTRVLVKHEGCDDAGS